MSKPFVGFLKSYLMVLKYLLLL